jgi:hypothetical protein
MPLFYRSFSLSFCIISFRCLRFFSVAVIFFLVMPPFVDYFLFFGDYKFDVHNRRILYIFFLRLS